MESLNLQTGGKRRSSRKGASKKQLAALARGRAIRAKNIRNNRSSKKKSSKKKSSKKKSGQKGGAGHITRPVSRNWGKLKAASSANAFISFTKKQIERKLQEVVRVNRLGISSQQLNELLNVNIKKRDHMRGIEKYSAYVAELVKHHSPRTSMNNIQNIYDNIVIETTKKLSSKKQDVLDVSLVLHKVTEQVLKDNINQSGGDLPDALMMHVKEDTGARIGIFQKHPYVGAAILLGSVVTTGVIGAAIGYQLSGSIMGAVGSLVTVAVHVTGENTENVVDQVRWGLDPQPRHRRAHVSTSKYYMTEEEKKAEDLSMDRLREPTFMEDPWGAGATRFFGH